MISDASFRILRFTFEWASFAGGIPFEWDRKRRKLISSPLGWTKWTMWLVFLCINCFFYLGRLAYVLLIERKQETEGGVYVYHKIKGYQLGIMYMVGFVLNSNIWYHYEEILCLVNSLIQHSQYIESKFVKKFPPDWNNGCENILRFLIVLMIMIPGIATVVYFLDPHDMRYITSFLDQPPLTPRPIYIFLCVGYGILYAMWTICALSNVLFHCQIWILGSCLLLQMLGEIKGGLFSYTTRPLLRRSRHLCNSYRSLQILVRLWNDAFACCMFPVKGSAQFMSIIGNGLLLTFSKMESPLARLMLAIGPNSYLGVFLMALYYFGQLYKRSVAIRKSWHFLKFRDYQDFLLVRKFSRSAAPLKIRISEKYFVKPGRVLATVNSVLRQTFKIVIGVKKQLHHY